MSSARAACRRSASGRGRPLGGRSEPPAATGASGRSHAAATQPPPPPTAKGRAPDRKVLDRLVEVAAMADKPAAQAIPALTQVVRSTEVEAVPRPCGPWRAWARRPAGRASTRRSTTPPRRCASRRSAPRTRRGTAFPSTRINDMAQSDPDTAVRAAAKSLLDNGGSDDGGQGDNGDETGTILPPTMAATTARAVRVSSGRPETPARVGRRPIANANAWRRRQFVPHKASQRVRGALDALDLGPLQAHIGLDQIDRDDAAA